jgi:proline dehydrogenase
MFHQVRPFSSLEAALAEVTRLNADGIAGSLSYLPVLKNSPSAVARECEVYERMLDGVARRHLNCDVTLKLHQLGVYGAEGLAERSVRRIAEYAGKKGSFVWIDMERPDTVDATVELFRSLWTSHIQNIGICLQSYLTRTERDLILLTSHGAPVRMVKGFYAGYDMKPWREVTANYARLLPWLLERSGFPAVATHDRELIAQAEHYIRSHGLERKAEFQFFSGVRDDDARRLAADGFRVRVYVPWGGMGRFLRSGLSTFDTVHQLERMFGFMPWA